jgi:hypothetical protein
MLIVTTPLIALPCGNRTHSHHDLSSFSPYPVFLITGTSEVTVTRGSANHVYKAAVLLVDSEESIELIPIKLPPSFLLLASLSVLGDRPVEPLCNNIFSLSFSSPSFFPHLSDATTYTLAGVVQYHRRTFSLLRERTIRILPRAQYCGSGCESRLICVCMSDDKCACASGQLRQVRRAAENPYLVEGEEALEV